MVETAQKLKGVVQDKSWIGSLLLAGLPENFVPMIMVIDHSGISITIDTIKTNLLKMESEFSKAGSAFANKLHMIKAETSRQQVVGRINMIQLSIKIVVANNTS